MSRKQDPLATPYGFASQPEDIETDARVTGGDVMPERAVVFWNDPKQSERFAVPPDTARERADGVEEHTPEYRRFAVKLRALADQAEAMEEHL